LSLIADSLKKAVKEKSFNVAPGINLLKNLGAKAKPTTQFDPKEIKRFLILIVIPATLLVYLLLAKPFTPNKIPVIVPPSVATQIPSPPVAPKSLPIPPAPVTAVVKERESIVVVEPEMEEASAPKQEVQATLPKPVAGPKKQALAAPAPVMAPPLKPEKHSTETNLPVTENTSVKIPGKNKLAEIKPTKVIDLKQPARVAESFAKAPASRTNKLSFPATPEPDIFKNSDYYFNQAIFYQQSKNWEKALTNYSKAAEIDANNPDIYNNIGVIYKELRQYDRAIEEFLRAVYLSPDNAKPYNNIGVVYYAKKDFSGAIRNYQKAIAIDPKNLEALNNLAVAYKRIGQLEQSKMVLNQALEINTAHSGTHYNLAVLYEEEGNFQSAIHFYQSFIELGSSTHPVLSARVKIHIKTLK
jgi:Flp pilus assembly protein TadD